MLIEILGWTGSLLVLIAYAMNISKKLSADSLTYYLLNIAGSSFLIVHTAIHHAFPSMVVNIIWVFIPVVTIVRANRKKNAVSSIAQED
jgi:predicted membrane protein